MIAAVTSISRAWRWRRTRPNRANALKLMEYLASRAGPEDLCDGQQRVPGQSAVEPSDIVKSWGTLKPDALPLENIAKFRKRASELVDKVNFDAGPSLIGTRPAGSRTPTLNFLSKRLAGPRRARALICRQKRLVCRGAKVTGRARRSAEANK